MSTDCCCGDPPPTCCSSGDCCFSDNSTAQIEISFNTGSWSCANPSECGNKDVSITIELPYYSCSSGSVTWYKSGTGGGTITYNGSSWNGNAAIPVGINCSPLLVYFSGSGNCCGGTLSVMVEPDSCASSGITGSATLTMQSNKCCRCSDGSCVPTSDGSDATCGSSSNDCTAAQDDDCPLP